MVYHILTCKRFQKIMIFYSLFYLISVPFQIWPYIIKTKLPPRNKPNKKISFANVKRGPAYQPVNNWPFGSNERNGAEVIRIPEGLNNIQGIGELFEPDIFSQNSKSMEESYVSQGVIFDILQYDCQQIQLLYGLYKHIINTFSIYNNTEN